MTIRIEDDATGKELPPLSESDALYFATWEVDAVRLGRHFLASHANHDLSPLSDEPKWTFACSCGESPMVTQTQVERAYYEANAAGHEAVVAFLEAIGPAK